MEKPFRRTGLDYDQSSFQSLEITKHLRRLQRRLLKRLAKIRPRSGAQEAEGAESHVEVVHEIGRPRTSWLLRRESYRRFAHQPQSWLRQLVSREWQFGFERSRELVALPERSAPAGRETKESQQPCSESIDQPPHPSADYLPEPADQRDWI